MIMSKPIGVQLANSSTRFSEPESQQPVKIADVQNLTQREKKQLIARYRRVGFALFQVEPGQDGRLVVERLSRQLQVGEPYVPDYYTQEAPHIYGANKLNIICDTGGDKHAAFHTSNAQGLHCDGTLEREGAIRTTILYCEMDAERNGETILMDSVAAFCQLFREDLYGALALMDIQALRRYGQYKEQIGYVGPAFAIKGSRIVSRFSDDVTCDWQYGFDRVQHLKRAYRYMVRAARPGSACYLEMMLLSGQGIIMANDRIAHGRKSFIDGIHKKRRFVRGLFLEPPALGEVE